MKKGDFPSLTGGEEKNHPRRGELYLGACWPPDRRRVASVRGRVTFTSRPVGKKPKNGKGHAEWGLSWKTQKKRPHKIDDIYNSLQ